MSAARCDELWPGTEFRRIADQTPWLVWVSDANAKATYLNSAWLRFRGRTLEQELGDGWAEGMHPEDRDRSFQLFARAFEAREPFETEYRLRRHDGIYRWVLDQAAPLTVDGRLQGYVGCCLDFTERRRSEEISEQIQRLAQIGGWELNVEENRLYWTDETHRLHRTDPETFVPNVDTAIDFYVPEDRPRIRAAVETGVAERRAWDEEYQIIRADGRRRWVRAVGQAEIRDEKTVRLFGAFQDIDHRKRSEIERERFFQLSLDLMTIVRTERPDTFDTVSDSFTRVLGWSREELTTRPYTDFVVEEDREQTLGQVDHLQHGGQVLGFENRYRTKSGGIKVLQWSAVPDDDAWYCIARDVTEQRRLQGEQRKLEEAMRNAQRLEGLGLLAGGVAHDFNNLLTSILANAEVLGTRFGNDPAARKSSEQIRGAVRQAASLCEQLLTYAGRGQRSTEALDLSAMTREMAELLATSVGRGVRLHLECADDLPTVDADASQLRQVILNLITNAAESFPSGEEGQVVLTTSVGHLEDDDRERFQLAPTASAKEWVRLEVRDTGSGLAPVARDRIFEPFFTTKSDGRGLGLAVVRGIVAGHGGGLAVDSVPGEGTQFEIVLPAGGVAPETEARLVDESLRGEGTVLVVDDDQEVRRAATILLEHLGFDVLAAERGEGALELLEAGGAVRLVLLDLTMPGLGGEETLRAIRGRWPDLPVVLISGFSRKEIDLDSFGAPAVLFLSKPFDAEQLLRTMRRALAWTGVGVG